jgi:hypothetical protein
MTKHTCPSCGSQEISRNGRTRHGKQNYKCRDCGRQFVLDPTWKAITSEQYELIERMLLERVSLAGIARILQISEDTVQRYVNAKAVVVPQHVEVSEKPKKRLNVQMDELWSFVEWMSYGHLSMIRAMSNGFGWRSMPKPERLLGSRWETGVRCRLKRCGTRCRLCIGNVR